MTGDDAELPMIETFVDMVRYPLHDLDREVGIALVRDARQQLRESGYAELSGFLNPQGVQAFVDDAGSLTCRAHAVRRVGHRIPGAPRP